MQIKRDTSVIVNKWKNLADWASAAEWKKSKIKNSKLSLKWFFLIFYINDTDFSLKVIH